MRQIEIIPLYYGNKNDKYVINIPDDTINVDDFLKENGIECYCHKEIF